MSNLFLGAVGEEVTTGGWNIMSQSIWEREIDGYDLLLAGIGTGIGIVGGIFLHYTGVEIGACAAGGTIAGGMISRTMRG